MRIAAIRMQAKLPLRPADASFIARILLTIGVIFSAFVVIHDVHNIRTGNEILNALYREEMRLIQFKGEILLERSNLKKLGHIESQAILVHEMKHQDAMHVEVWP